MRRRELAAGGAAFFAEVAGAARVGHLALPLPDRPPRAIALDFAADGETIYFHGALAGQKHDAILAGPRVGFTMVRELSFIPSTWLAPEHACPATHLFQSVELVGTCTVVNGREEKARALQRLMEKYQPQGGFAEVAAGNPIYRRSLERVGIFRIATDTWTGKLKLGQNETAAIRRRMIAGLRQRGEPLDVATAALIEATLDETPAGS